MPITITPPSIQFLAVEVTEPETTVETADIETQTTTRVYNTQQKKFRKMLREGLKYIEAHKKGTKQFKSLEQMLSEL